MNEAEKLALDCASQKLTQLPAVRISAVSYLNASGASAPGESTSDLSRAALEGSALSCASLCKNFEQTPCGWVTANLTPLPQGLHLYESRTARLLASCLTGLQNQLEAATAKYGAARIGVVLGSATGGVDASERALRYKSRTGELPNDYHFAAAHPYSALLDVVRGLSPLRGPMFVISTACSSAGKALGSAQRLLALDLVDAVLCGGVDALSGMTLAGFNSLGLLAEGPCMPFAAERDGISLGEGAALFLLERDSESSFSLLGVGESSDAHHSTAPHPEGVGARLAIRRCLAVAGLSASQIRYVQAHGTGTKQNDAVESQVLATELPGVPFSSTKDRTGHLLGAAAATSSLYCLHALHSGEIPMTQHQAKFDESLAATPTRSPELLAPRGEPATVLLNAFAFGGNNVSVALGCTGSSSTSASPTPPSTRATVLVRAVSSYSDGSDLVPSPLLSRRAWGRASQLSKIYCHLLAELTQSAPLPVEALAEIPLFFGSGFGELQTSLDLLDQLTSGEPVSPAKFQASVHNTAAGLLSIATRNQSPTSALSAGASTAAMSLLEATAWLQCHGGRALVLIADESSTSPLLRGARIEAAGAGFLLETGGEGATPSLRLEQELADEEHDLPTSERLCPTSWALPLVAALREGRAGTVMVGPHTRAHFHAPSR